MSLVTRCPAGPRPRAYTAVPRGLAYAASVVSTTDDGLYRSVTTIAPGCYRVRWCPESESNLREDGDE